ncbi:MAG: hypothetical protein DRG24_02565 [Epsilonproteobacteria bacterium]|nr:MAG: hypothetical protein DRG24_02565 [Campylobacterota bacterium]
MKIKWHHSIFILVAGLLLATPLSAEKVVIKTATVNRMLHADKSIDELKALAIQKAKYEAAKEIFGELLLSETVMANGKIIEEMVREKSGGVIHIRGEPQFANGKNLGDVQVTIEAYATDEDIKDTTPQPIVLNNFTYTNDDVPIKKLKALAEDAYIMEALATKKPSIRYASPEAVRKQAVSIELTKMDFDIDTFTYTMSGKIEYIPAFLRHSDMIKTDSLEKRFQKDEASIPIAKPARKKGFYGLWSGYIMRSNGSSTSVEIEITGTGESTIAYPSLFCGGDLLVQTKRTRRVEFKETLTYGQDNCTDKLQIVLRKIDDDQLEYREFDSAQKERGKGTLYREEMND